MISPLPGSVLSWPKRRSRAATSVRMWCPESHKWFWVRTRPSPTTMSSTWTLSRKPSTPTARRGSLRVASRATTPPSSHMGRLVLLRHTHPLVQPYLKHALLKGVKLPSGIYRVWQLMIWNMISFCIISLVIRKEGLTTSVSALDRLQPALNTTAFLLLTLIY